MKKSSRTTPQQTEWKRKPSITVGLDLGDRWSHYCLLNEDGDLVEEGRIATSEAGIRKQFEGEPRQRVAMECGTHSPWISRLLQHLGHQVIVANARKLRAISQNESKNDKADAEMLARLALSDPRLLSPLQHRSVERQRDLNLIRSRDVLVRARTMLVNAVRGLVKSAGGRLPACSAQGFEIRAASSIPPSLATAAHPLIQQIAAITASIHEMDRGIEQLAERYAEIKLLRTVPGIGPLIAAAYVLTLDRPDAIQHSRQAGAFLGLRPRQTPRCAVGD
jgi:transposase